MCSTPEGIEGGRTAAAAAKNAPCVKCSTPEGIEGGRTVPPAAGGPACPGAQRPRASKGVARRIGEPFVDERSVLNARGHRRGSHRTFRSKACGTTARAQRPRASKGVARVTITNQQPQMKSAQRPRASKGVAPDGLGHDHDGVGCSTPEGIEGGRTAIEDLAGNGGSVLNARGHRRGSHDRHPVLLGSARCAQRPRASKGVAPWHPSFTRAPRQWCSTPEGIEGGRTTPARCGRRPKRVLNARGHRRGSHLQRRGASPPNLARVLNARGHRRGSHDITTSPDLQGTACSTPEGIEGGRTRSTARRSSGQGRVLNARGHRRGSHAPSGQAGGARIAACSTPEGIEGGRTRASSPWPLAQSSAQRPRASKGVAPGPSTSGTLVHRPCSTPEGIEGGRTASASSGPFSPRCAQRPRASKGVALPFLLVDAHRDEVLNARGHRRGSHGAVEELGRQLQSVLNARGHRRGSHRESNGRRRRRLRAQRPRASKGVAPAPPAPPSTPAPRAQRPRASKGVALQPGQRRRIEAAVLNARGHRRGSHTKPPVLGK